MAKFKNLQELFLTAQARWAPCVAFRHIADGMVCEIRYQDLASLTYRAAQALWSRGLRPGNRLAICAANSPEWVIACIGALRLGAILVPLDARSRAGEILPVLERVQPELVLLGEKQYVQNAQHIPSTNRDSLTRLFQADDLPEIPHLQSPGNDDPALIVFTSGTASAAKGVVLTHGNILSNVIAAANNFAVSSDDRFLSVLPLSHMLEFTGGFLGPIHKGASIVYSQIKGPAHLKALLKFEKASIMLATPAVFERLYEDIQAVIEKLPRTQQVKIALARRVVEQEPSLGPLLLKDLHRELGGHVKFWLAGGAPTSPELVRGMRSLGIRLLSGYGLTEAAPIVAANTRTDNKPDGVGRPLPGIEVRIDNPCAQGNGEILIKGANVMQGYLDNPKETERVIRNGWLHSGDSGFLDSDGHLHITGRIKSMIVTAGGYNIYPEEIEEALLKSKLIKEVSVFGQKTPKGESVCALIVPHESLLRGEDSDERIKLEINEALADLADYKRLSSYVIYPDRLPRTASGKICRGNVIKLFEQRQQEKKHTKKSKAKQPVWDALGAQVCELIAEVMEPAVLKAVCPSGSRLLSPDLSLDADLGLDSFCRLELASRLEQELCISVPESSVQELVTVEDVVALVAYRQEIENESSPTQRRQYPEDAEMAEGESPVLSRWQPWPAPYVDTSSWPQIQEEPLLVAGRKALDIGLQVFLRTYNKLEVSGSDHLLLDPPYIIAANHSSHMDVLALLASLPPSLVPIVHPVAAADYFFANTALSVLSTYLLNAVPFDRFGRFEESMKYCQQLLRMGRILIIFPEGTRSADGTMGTFKPGAAHLSITVGCPIIPAYIKGASRVLRKGELVPRPEELQVSVGLPLYPPLVEPNVQNCQQFTRRLYAAVCSLGTPATTPLEKPAEPADKDQSA